MLKLTPVDTVKNTYVLYYQAAHTDVYERDIWLHDANICLMNVENEEDLKIYLRCFNITKEKVDESRKGRGEPAEYIGFDEYIESEEFESVEWLSDEGFVFTKNGREFFVPAGTDMGMPREDGHFTHAINLSYITYFDENGQEFVVEIE